jgi:3-methyladenine DNA glycosylase Tag
MVSFKHVYNLAAERKGGEAILKALIPPVLPEKHLQSLTSDRCLALMTRGIFQAGFVWKVIESKWPGFEEVFLGFDIEKLNNLLPEEWDEFASEKKIVRNPQKIRAVYENMLLIRSIEESEGKPFAQFIADWPSTDLIGLWSFLKRKGSRLGGMTGQYLLRRAGKDSFILSRDVVACLQAMGLDIRDTPTSKKDLTLIQNHFNKLHQETKLPFTELSKIMSFSTGENYEVEFITTEMNRFEKEPNN